LNKKRKEFLLSVKGKEKRKLDCIYSIENITAFFNLCRRNNCKA